jgi:RNA polymerase sigma-70 factor (ECF subfamily)
VAPHLAEARALAQSITRSGADSEDVVQEACLRALRGIAGFGGKNARAWVLTIVRHTAYDWIRKRRTAPQAMEDVSGLAEQFGCEGASVSPESHLVSQERVQRLMEAVRSLPESFRETLVLRYGKGLAYKQIAEFTGVPTGTVMSRLSRARQLVGQSLGVTPQLGRKQLHATGQPKSTTGAL